MKNVEVRVVEGGQSFRGLVNAWNIKIAQWLHRDVFSRSLATYGAQRATALTYFVSAFWHGTYPVYYVAFLTGALISLVEKAAWRRAIRVMAVGSAKQTTIHVSSKKKELALWAARLLVAPSSLWTRVVRMLVTHLLLAYLTIAFLLLEWTAAWTFWYSLGFYGHILPLLVYMML